MELLRRRLCARISTASAVIPDILTQQAAEEQSIYSKRCHSRNLANSYLNLLGKSHHKERG